MKNHVIGFFEKAVLLRSGQRSHWYVNWRNVAKDVFLMDRLTTFVIEFVREQGLSPDCFYGVSEGATKLGVLAQYKWAKQSESYSEGSHCLAMGRGKAKEHGSPSDRYFLGKPEGKVIVLEDVTTTGGALIESIQRLHSSNISVLAAISLTDRNQPLEGGKFVSDLLSSLNVPFFSMSQANALLPMAIERYQPSKQVIESIMKSATAQGTTTCE